MSNLNPDQFGSLYHGTDHEVEVGDVIRPGARPSNYPEHWGTSQYAWATSHPSEVMLHGSNRYTVAPVDPSDVKPDDREPNAWASKAGFKVTGRLSNEDMKTHVARFRGRA